MWWGRLEIRSLDFLLCLCCVLWGSGQVAFPLWALIFPPGELEGYIVGKLLNFLSFLGEWKLSQTFPVSQASLGSLPLSAALESRA